MIKEAAVGRLLSEENEFCVHKSIEESKSLLSLTPVQIKLLNCDSHIDVNNVPCLDIVPKQCHGRMERFRVCVEKKLKERLGRILDGCWADPHNITFFQIGGGLSNFLFCAKLKNTSACSLHPGEQEQVLVRVFGEVLRKSVDSTVLDSVIFAILSERKMGPTLYGVFPGGRIEQFIPSRPLKTSELPLPVVSASIAIHLGRLHCTHMPMTKRPTEVFHTMASFVEQLSNPDPNQKATRLSDVATFHHSLRDVLEQQQQSASDTARSPGATVWRSPERHTSAEEFDDLQCEKGLCLSGEEKEQQAEVFRNWSEEVTRILKHHRVVEEINWIRKQLLEVYHEKFPVTFCHNDLQENNILLMRDANGANCLKLMLIDLEYCSYNFRGFDIANHFNEWCFEYDAKIKDGYRYMPDAYPTEQQQIHFLKHYLSAFHEQREAVDYQMSDHVEYNRSACGDDVVFDSNHLPDDLSKVNGLSLMRDGKKTVLSEKQSLIEEEINSMWLEIDYGALLSHIFWASWSLVQAFVSSIEFGYLEYAQVRLNQYHELKQKIVARETNT